MKYYKLAVLVFEIFIFTSIPFNVPHQPLHKKYWHFILQISISSAAVFFTQFSGKYFLKCLSSSRGVVVECCSPSYSYLHLSAESCSNSWHVINYFYFSFVNTQQQQHIFNSVNNESALPVCILQNFQNEISSLNILHTPPEQSFTYDMKKEWKKLFVTKAFPWKWRKNVVETYCHT